MAAKWSVASRFAMSPSSGPSRSFTCNGPDLPPIASPPVIAQATGFEEFLQTGEGLFAVKDLEEAEATINAVSLEPERHALAARALAEKYFDSDKVPRSVLDRAGVV